jgi:outer membrane protein OmpA-like peptidoglycan-associated protein
MSESETRAKHQAYALAGEGMPKWLTLGFALIGLLTAVAAAWVFLTDRSVLPQRSPPAATARQESAPQGSLPAAAPQVAQSPSSPMPISTADADDARRPEPSKSSPPEPAAADGKQLEAPPDQAASSKTPSPAARIECPAIVSVLFDSGSAQPKGTDLDARLTPLRTWLVEHPESKLLVEGHADSTGTEQWNLILSYRRAKALVALLRKAGLPREQLVVRAAGTLQPVAGLPDSAARNRRVVLQLEDGANCRSSSSDGESQS